MKFTITAFCLLINLALAKENDFNQFEQSITDVNQYLSNNEDIQKICPGLKLSISCGNNICEK